ncbi:hypothetical protein TPB0596_12470 [Tsukamurella pulmonis]|uniref:hypothetical protein n=1 Tax=Tsukamurella pulmonis TaxID=47312 RepID=UPI001EDF8CE9|nr:hypothetical protein [Tsukamurella pulmonis]BDD81484.1 hypothetical protein TPB0596_12470 [Tsukamurella pulmonis]
MVEFWPIHTPKDPAWQEATAEEREWATQCAVELLWMRSGRSFGLTEVSARPCFTHPRPSTYSGYGGIPHGGTVQSWWPFVPPSSAHLGPCSCGARGCNTGRHEIPLPAPIHKMLAVTIDGVELPATAWKTRNRRWLLRTDGQPWPEQDLDVGDDAPGAWVVRYVKGVPVPAMGQQAAGDLALELLKGMNLGACALPDRVSSIARQGIQVDMQDLQAIFEAQGFGIPSCDRWVAMVNPSRQRARAAVFSPDRHVAARLR